METTGGRWLAEEIAECEHINCLELKAAKLGLLPLCEKEEHVHIHLHSDNVTPVTVTFINNMGGTHSTTCNKVARRHLAVVYCKEDLAKCYAHSWDSK